MRNLTKPLLRAPTRLAGLAGLGAGLAATLTISAALGNGPLHEGEHRSPIMGRDDRSSHHSLWSSPEQDVILYAGQHGTSGVVCPYLPGSRLQPFCRHFGSPMIGACGHSDRITIVLSNGDIHRVNNAVIDAAGAFKPVHAQSTALQLTDAWFPEPGCPDELPEVFATNAEGMLWHFNGRVWQLLAGNSVGLASRHAAVTAPIRGKLPAVRKD